MTTETNYTATELTSMTVSELRKLARAKGNQGAWVLNLSKSSLVNLICQGFLPDQVVTEASAKKANVGENLAELIAQAIQGHLESTPSDLDEIRVLELIADQLKQFRNNDATKDMIAKQIDEAIKKLTLPREVEVKTVNGEKINVGLTHERFERILRHVNKGLNLWIWGESGSGKTHVASQVAKALNLPYYCQSVTSQTTKSDLMGFMDANGNYVESLLYKAFAFGGLYCNDESDAGNANVMLALNSATSNELCSFPCGMVQKHENFRIVACANTIGDGANRQYVGRSAQDAASKNRYVYVKMDTDWNLVQGLVEAQYGEYGRRAYKILMEKREKINACNLTNIMVTTRTIMQAADLLSEGDSIAEMLEEVLYKGCDQSTVNKIS
jgi:cobaltochelatase CobS